MDEFTSMCMIGGVVEVFRCWVRLSVQQVNHSLDACFQSAACMSSHQASEPTNS
jgi:hypothetical protein